MHNCCRNEDISFNKTPVTGQYWDIFYPNFAMNDNQRNASAIILWFDNFDFFRLLFAAHGTMEHGRWQRVRRYFVSLKGLSHEIDLKNVDENGHILALLKGPKCEIFGFGFFALIRPIWIG
jgi:hypothetical protein